MPGTKLFARRSDTPPHPIYFSGKDVTMYLSGIVDPKGGRKRIIFEIADSIGAGDFKDKAYRFAQAILESHGFRTKLDRAHCEQMLEAFELRDFEETFKNVLLAAHASKRELFTAYVGRGKVSRPDTGKR